LAYLRKFLDKSSNVLSEPGKIQVQMVEGEAVFNEAIDFLNSITYLKPLQWDENLAMSAIEHVLDIGPKGLLSYQSSDGTEPEERISKYGNYVESLGENIDFGPNDAMGVIVSLTLDDGEPDRPHRENLFKADYLKIGIACGPHKTEYQMCVMDFAYDFMGFNEEAEHDGEISHISQDTVTKSNITPPFSNQTHQAISPNQSNKNQIQNGNKNDGNKILPNMPVPSSNTHIPQKHNNYNELDMFVDPSSTANFNNTNTLISNKNQKQNRNEETFGYPREALNTAPSQMYHNTNTQQNVAPSNVPISNQSPLVRLSLDNDEVSKNHEKEKLTKIAGNPSHPLANVHINQEEDEALISRVKQLNLQKKVVSKTVEVTTKVIYTYEDGSIREVVEKQNHVFDLTHDS
jgi:uncharacterized protein YkwD